MLHKFQNSFTKHWKRHTFNQKLNKGTGIRHKIQWSLSFFPEEEEAEVVDPYDLMDPVDILSKIPKDYYEKVVGYCSRQEVTSRFRF